MACLQPLTRMKNFRLEIYEGAALYIGRDVRTKPHLHHALEIALALEGRFSVFTNASCLEDVTIAVVGSDELHAFSSDAALTAFIYLDNEIQQTHQITEKLCLKEIPLITLEAAIFDKERVALSSWFEGDDSNILGSQIIRAVIEKISHTPATASISFDLRIKEVLRFIQESVFEEKLSISRLASMVSLSESRLAHLFKAQTGIPVRKYILWMRIQKAVVAVLQGFDLTEAAYQAGFADSAHLSRTFVDMFGVTPSSVLKT